MGEVLHAIIDSELISSTCDRLANRDLLAETLGTSTFQVEPAQAAVLRKHLAMLVGAALNETRLFASERIQQVVRTELITRLLATIPDRSGNQHRSRASLARRRKIVDAVEGYLQESPDEAPSIVDLCKIAHASERTIAYAFQSFWDMSPAVYLKRVRLNRARNDLQRMESAETNVQAVANNWGFWHMGHFARNYKTLFHELPSETLARRTFR